MGPENLHVNKFPGEVAAAGVGPLGQHAALGCERGWRFHVPAAPAACDGASPTPLHDGVAQWPGHSSSFGLFLESEEPQGHNRPKSAWPNHSFLLRSASAPAPLLQGAPQPDSAPEANTGMKPVWPGPLLPAWHFTPTG